MYMNLKLSAFKHFWFILPSIIINLYVVLIYIHIYPVGKCWYTYVIGIIPIHKSKECLYLSGQRVPMELSSNYRAILRVENDFGLSGPLEGSCVTSVNGTV